VTSGLPTLLVIAGLAAAGLLLSQAAYRGAGLTAPLATVTVVNPVVAAAVGITMFGEQFRYGLTGTLLALACGALAAAGLVLLTTERVGAEKRRSEEAAAGERTPEGHADAPKAPRPVVVPEKAKPVPPQGAAVLPDPFPAPTALSLPLTLPLDHGGGRVELGARRPAAGPARRGDLEGRVQTLTPPALR
jgi:hypothetical protein